MKKLTIYTLLLAAAAPAAFAADHAYDGKWMLRARALGVVPEESSSLNIGGHVNVDNSIVPELDATYFFTPNIAAEVIAAVTPHDVKTNTGVDAGSAWLLPPTITLQYH